MSLEDGARRNFLEDGALTNGHGVMLKMFLEDSHTKMFLENGLAKNVPGGR